MCKSCPPQVEIVFSLQTLSFLCFIHFNFPWELLSGLLAIIIQLLSKMTVLRAFQRNLYHHLTNHHPPWPYQTHSMLKGGRLQDGLVCAGSNVTSNPKDWASFSKFNKQTFSQCQTSLQMGGWLLSQSVTPQRLVLLLPGISVHFTWDEAISIQNTR